MTAAFLLRVYDRLVAGLAGIAGVTLFVMAAMIVVDVVLRNLGLRPPQAISALTEYALLYATMAAAPWLVRIGGHVTIQTLTERLPAAVQSGLRVVVLLAVTLLCLLLAAAAFGMAAESFGRGDVDVRSIDLPRWLLFTPLALGFLLLAAEFFRLLILRDMSPEHPGEGF
ncbi:MAG: TRAP transporter small permease [Geminicoccaceae bacterium]